MIPNFFHEIPNYAHASNFPENEALEVQIPIFRCCLWCTIDMQPATILALKKIEIMTSIWPINVRLTDWWLIDPFQLKKRRTSMNSPRGWHEILWGNAICASDCVAASVARVHLFIPPMKFSKFTRLPINQWVSEFAAYCHHQACATKSTVFQS